MFRVLVALATSLGLSVLPAPPDEVTPLESHCVLFVVDQHEDGEFVMSSPQCFDDEAAAAKLVSEGYDASEDAQRGVRGVVASSSFTLGKHYDGSNGSGSSVTIVGSSCSGGWWNTSSSWDNRISSSYNGCGRLRHWDYPNKAGASESTYGAGTTDNLGFMNNKTESVSYHSG